MKVICTTSDKYLHLIPVMTYLFNKNWDANQEVTIVGYQSPKCELPLNFKFHSMGVQGHVSEWSTDLRKYFETIEDEWFVWIMEDTFIKSMTGIPSLSEMFNDHYNVGRIDLTGDLQKRFHSVNKDLTIIIGDSNVGYRLSTQPSIWNKRFLLQYMLPGLTPWKFETQDPRNDNWTILSFYHPPMKHNEGVRKHDPHLLNLDGLPIEDCQHINTLL